MLMKLTVDYQTKDEMVSAKLREFAASSSGLEFGSLRECGQPQRWGKKLPDCKGTGLAVRHTVVTSTRALVGILCKSDYIVPTNAAVTDGQ